MIIIADKRHSGRTTKLIEMSAAAEAEGRYGVGWTAIQKIITRQSWTHV